MSTTKTIEAPTTIEQVCTAIESGDYDQVESLLQGAENLDLNSYNAAGFAPLHTAIYCQNYDLVELLLPLVDINKKAADGSTCLSIAVENEDYDMVEYLLDQGAQVNGTDNDGYTALHICAEHDFVDMAELLLAREDCNVDAVTKDLVTPVHVAAELGHLAMCQLLVKTYKANVNVKDKLNATPLEVAQQNKKLLVMKFLIEEGAQDIEDNDFNLRTPLHEACIANNFAVVKEIVSKFKDVAKEINFEDNSRSTALHYACLRKNYLLAKFLLEHNAYVNAYNDEKWTPLRIAVKMSDITLTTMLAASGAFADKHTLTEVASADVLKTIMTRQRVDKFNKGFDKLFERCLKEDRADLIAIMVEYGGLDVRPYILDADTPQIKVVLQQSPKFAQYLTTLKRMFFNRSSKVVVDSIPFYADSLDMMNHIVAYQVCSSKPVRIEFKRSDRFWLLQNWSQLRQPIFVQEVFNTYFGKVPPKFKRNVSFVFK